MVARRRCSRSVTGPSRRRRRAESRVAAGVVVSPRAHARGMELHGDCVAVVTGAGAGIGEAVAQRLAFEGAAVVVVDVDEAAAEACVKSIVGCGGRAIAYAADVTRPSEVARFVAFTAKVLGRLDVLVNNAGGVEGSGYPWSPEEQWGATIDLNLRAPMCAIQAALPLLCDDGGAIVN